MKWTVDPNNRPGPIQTNRANKAIASLRMEHNTYRELWGIIGLKDGSFDAEHTSVVTEIFGTNCREDVGAVQEKLFKRFNGIVSRSNVNDVISAIESEMVTLKANRPVREDHRQTQEQHDKEQAEMQARAAQERAQREAEQAALHAQKQSTGTIGTVKLNDALGGVEIHFDGKPAQEVIDRLHYNKFRWARGSRCWYKKQSEYNIKLAYEIAGATRPTPKVPDMGVDRFDMQVEDNMAQAAGVA